ncbi:MAG: RNA 3'-terminal phosphate cyclase [Thermofilum sp.]
MIEIDGSFGEGGGQLLRYSVALAALLGTPIRVYNIRAKRDNPGLRPQHLSAVKHIAELVGARVEGLKVGSTEIKLFPQRAKVRGGRYTVDIGTAGSVTLFLQATLPVLLNSDGRVELEVRGGTSVRWSPPYRYFENVLLHLLQLFGARVSARVLREGFYPEGGGIVRVVVDPSYPMTSVDLSRPGEPSLVEGVSYVSNLPCHIAERQASSAREILLGRGFEVKDIEVLCNVPSIGRGSGIVLWSRVGRSVVGGDSIGEKGKPAEQVGREAAESLAGTLSKGVPVDPHASDNLVIYMALASGESTILTTELTSHAETALMLCREITGASFKVEKVERGVRISVKGIGYGSRA